MPESQLLKNERTKRVFDLIVVLIGGIFLFIPALLFMIGLKINQIIYGRPFLSIFYSEIRYTKGRPFRLYKFNIYQPDILEAARASGKPIQTKQFEWNGQLLMFGLFLKQIYMDELPQLWSILKGDMTLVGPRPANEETFRVLMSRGIDSKAKTKAGLTGLYQSNKNSVNNKSKDQDEKYVNFLEEKSWYQILWLDIKILAQTLRLISKAEGL